MRHGLVLSLTATLLVLGGCAGMNPNPGERTADMANESGDYSRAV